MRSVFWMRILIVFALVPIVLLCLIGGILSYAFGKTYITNNQILREYERKFNQISHPTDTSKVAFERRVTHPTGNGSNCFYFVGEVRRFSGDRSSIEAFYIERQVELLFFENKQLDRSYLYELDRLFSWGISKTNSDENFYLVYTLDTRINEDNSIDLRCSL